MKPLKSRKIRNLAGLQISKSNQLGISQPSHQTHRRIKLIIRSRRGSMSRIMMHPLVTFASLLVGVLMVGLSLQASAIDYQVRARVEAPPLTIGATITSPQNNSTMTKRPIEVTGFCPNESYVKLIRNGTFSGTAICSQGSFSILTDLSAGNNDLQAQAYNITDQAGPITAIVRVVYTVPDTVPVTGPTARSSGVINSPSKSNDDIASRSRNTTAVPAFRILGEYQFQVVTLSELYETLISFQNGAVPFNIVIDWGDGTKTRTAITSGEQYGTSHRYTSRGYYPIIMTARDTDGQTAMLQLAAFVKAPGEPATSGNILDPPQIMPPSNNDTYQWLRYVWPVYGFICIMLVSFWLGERREFLRLMKNHRSHKMIHHN